jgi:6-phospho-beta-glucosidase
MVVSTQNNGAIRDLPDDCIVEVSSIITGKGPIPMAWGKFAPSERGWLQLMKAMEECVIEAAITGNYRLALAAFEMNPMVEHGHVAQTVLDELLVAHEKYLPQFADKIAELKAKGVMPKDPVVRDLMAQGL